MGDKDPAAAAGSRGRFSTQCKQDAVIRLLRGESLELLSRELGMTAATLSGWRDQFLAGGRAALKSRQPDAQAEEIGRLQAKIGELTMDNEVLAEKVHRMEGNLPFRRRRSRP